MKRFSVTSRLSESAERAFAWHERPGAFERLAPPWAPPRILERRGTIRDGDEVTLEVPAGPVPVKWRLVHEGHVAGARFVDRQVSGPFASWVHTHEVVPLDAGSCEWRDQIDYELPGGWLGRSLAGGAIERDLCAVFVHRHAQLASDLRRHAAAGAGRLRIAVSGASGLIGSALCAFLSTGGHEVIRLVRRPARGPDEISWDPEAGRVDEARLGGLDAVVHLAAESLATGRWTDERKRRIRASRVDGTATLAAALARAEAPPKVFVSASAVGIYGARTDAPADEESPPGSDFLGEVATAWEDAATPAAARGVRVVHARFGVVLSPGGGMLGRLLPVFKGGVGGRVGSGRQGLSWIALDDAVAAVHHAIVDERLRGGVNVVAPAPTDNAGFTETLADVLRRPAFLPVPAAAIKVAFGEMGEALLLGGPLARPRRLEETGFSFRFPELRGALAWALGRMDVPTPRREGNLVTLTL